MLDAVLKPTRSWLFTPAMRPDRFVKAAASGADVAILDLEDSVAPKDKAEARKTALEYLAGNPVDGVHHALRINGLDTLLGVSDLDALLGSSAAPDFLVLPKTETAGHLQILDRLLTAAGKQTRLIGLIESARSLAGVDAIAEATASPAMALTARAGPPVYPAARQQSGRARRRSPVAHQSCAERRRAARRKGHAGCLPHAAITRAAHRRRDRSGVDFRAAPPGPTAPRR